MKKVIIIIGVVIAAGIAWWLVSPLLNPIVLNEELPRDGSTNPPAISDSFERMSDATRAQFEQETAAMAEKVMVKEEEMPDAALGVRILASAPMVARAHEVEGTASIVEVGDTRYLRFENLKTINGPDLRIYLSSDLGVSDAIDLGPIRATEGSVNYELPAGIDITKYRNALIWCRAFSVLFSYAQF